MRRSLDLAQRRGDRGGLQPIERRLQAVIVARTRAAADESENLVWGGGHQARRAQPGVARLDDLAGGPDQDVGVPDRRHAVLGHGFDADGDVVHPVVDRRRAMRLGEAEEGIGHEILRVARREIAWQRPKEFELLAFGRCERCADMRSAARRTGRCRKLGGWRFAGRTVRLAGSDVDALAPRRDPRLEILDAIDHAPAELRVARARAVDAVLLEGANGQPDEAGGLGRAQIARRQDR